MQTENIVKYLQTAYSDENLAALFAHTQEGKLSYHSCCCFIGITNAPHALRGEMPEYALGRVLPVGSSHVVAARLASDLASAAEEEFFKLSYTDEERRAALMPLIEAEIARRDFLRHTPEFMEIIEAICE